MGNFIKNSKFNISGTLFFKKCFFEKHFLKNIFGRDVFFVFLLGWLYLQIFPEMAQNIVRGSLFCIKCGVLNRRVPSTTVRYENFLNNFYPILPKVNVFPFCRTVYRSTYFVLHGGLNLNYSCIDFWKSEHCKMRMGRLCT